LSPLEATFAVVGVRAGREELARRIYGGERVPVTIRGFIVSPWGRDEGGSREFAVEVVVMEEDSL
jgi:hypothetical protein